MLHKNSVTIDGRVEIGNFPLKGLIRLGLAPIISHQFGLVDFNRGFMVLNEGEAIKVLLDFTNSQEKVFAT